MATISTADFKNGMGLKINDKYYTIVEFQHVKPGKGGAFVRYKIRDLKTGRVIDQTCNALLLHGQRDLRAGRASR